MIKKSVLALLTIIVTMPISHAKGTPTFHTRYAEIDTTLQIDALAGPKDLACYLDTSGVLQTSSTSLSELESLIGVTANVQTQLDSKEPAISNGTSLQYVRADKNIATLNTAVVPESGNQYFTTGRVLATGLTGFSSGAGTITSADSVLTGFNKLNGNVALKEPAITSAATSTYWRGDKTFAILQTSIVPEVTNLYFTNARAIAAPLTGYVSGSGTVASTDSILQAIQKLNGNVGALTTGVSSVFGRTGAVVATSGDYNSSQVTENTNLYFTNARAIAAPITGYVSGSGTVAATDTVLQAINKLDGNTALKSNIASPTFTGVPSGPTATAGTNTTQFATTAFVTTAGAAFVPTTRTISTTAPITGGGDLSANRTFAIAASTNSVDGYLTAADHTSFAAKESALTFSTGLTRSTNTITVNASQNISTLSNLTSNGLVKTSGSTGALSIATAGTDYQAAGNYITGITGDVVATGPGSVSSTIQAGVVSNSKLANVATATFKGRTTAGTGSPEDLTATQATALLNNFVGDSGSGGTKGLVPAPAAGDAAAGKYLKADGTWATVSAGVGITSLNALTASTQLFANGTSGTAPAFSSSVATHTLNIPMASASSVTAGLLSKTDYDAFSAKPTGSGASGRVSYWSGASALTSSSSLLFDGTNFGVGATPDSILTVAKQTTIQAPVSGSAVHYIGLDANPLRVTYDTHNNASASGTALMFRRSRGTGGTPTAALSGDTLGSLNYRGYGATAYAAASTGLISVMAHQNFTDTAMGTYIAFSTTPDASVTAAEDWRILAGGKLSNTQADATAYLDLKAGTATAGTAPIHLTSGTNLTVPVSGTMEYNGTNLEFTDSTPTRHNITYSDSPAHTMMANNTGSTADRTAVVYNDNASATYAGTVTWTCGLAPTAPITNRYGWQQIGSHVTGWLMLNYATFGTTCTGIVMDLPAGMPAPLNPGGIGINGDFIWPAFFMQWTNRTTLPTALGRGSLRINAGGTGYEFQETFGSASMRSIHTTIDYWTQ